MPICDLEKFVIVVKELARFSEVDAYPFTNFFYTNYLGSFDAQGKSYDATFNPNLWNVYERVLNDIPRTTNSAEGWHKNLNSVTSVKTPNIAKVIWKMKT